MRLSQPQDTRTADVFPKMKMDAARAGQGMRPMPGLADHVFSEGSAPALQWCSQACAALESGKCLEVQYETFSRIVEVHRVGISPEGRHILSGWQIRGPANERPGWKLLNLDDAISLTVTETGSRAPRPDYRRGAKQFIGIICQL